jgi:hypothetical protein
MTEFLRQYAGSSGAASDGTGDPAKADQAASNNTSRALATGGSIFSALFSIGAGAAEAQGLERQAGDQMLAAATEEVQGQREANQIQRTALEASAARRVAFAASGVDLGSETVRVLDAEDDRFVQDALAERRNLTSRRAARRRDYARLLANRAAETFGGAVLGTISSQINAAGQAMGSGG